MLIFLKGQVQNQLLQTLYSFDEPRLEALRALFNSKASKDDEIDSPCTRLPDSLIMETPNSIRLDTGDLNRLPRREQCGCRERNEKCWISAP